jgi:hypothetical protein
VFPKPAASKQVRASEEATGLYFFENNDSCPTQKNLSLFSLYGSRRQIAVSRKAKGRSPASGWGR